MQILPLVLMVNLTMGTASSGDAQGDRLTSVEGLHDSQYADILTGDGNDTIDDASSGERLIFLGMTLTGANFFGSGVNYGSGDTVSAGFNSFITSQDYNNDGVMDAIVTVM